MRCPARAYPAVSMLLRIRSGKFDVTWRKPSTAVARPRDIRTYYKRRALHVVVWYARFGLICPGPTLCVWVSGPSPYDIGVWDDDNVRPDPHLHRARRLAHLALFLLAPRKLLRCGSRCASSAPSRRFRLFRARATASSTAGRIPAAILENIAIMTEGVLPWTVLLVFFVFVVVVHSTLAHFARGPNSEKDHLTVFPRIPGAARSAASATPGDPPR